MNDEVVMCGCAMYAPGLAPVWHLARRTGL